MTAVTRERGLATVGPDRVVGPIERERAELAARSDLEPAHDGLRGPLRFLGRQERRAIGRRRPVRKRAEGRTGARVDREDLGNATRADRSEIDNVVRGVRRPWGGRWACRRGRRLGRARNGDLCAACGEQESERQHDDAPGPHLHPPRYNGRRPWFRARPARPPLACCLRPRSSSRPCRRGARRRSRVRRGWE